jgi:hypothetical protein
MNYKTILPFTAAVLAMSVGFAAAQATPDSANVPQPHLAAALAVAAQENSWRHPGLGFLLLDRGGVGAGR